MDFISILSIFVLACFVGYFVVWSVTPALHTPLMSVTNAISSVIVVGALIAAATAGSPVSKWLGLAAVALAGAARLDAVTTYVESFSQTQKRQAAEATITTRALYRLPGDVRVERTVVTARLASVSAADFSIASSSSVMPWLVRSRPRNRFWTMSRLLQSARSWNTVSMPSAAASRGVRILTGRPSQ